MEACFALRSSCSVVAEFTDSVVSVLEILCSLQFSVQRLHVVDVFYSRSMDIHQHSHSSHGFHTAVDVKLNGDNYKIWAGSVRLILFGLDLLSHIDGSPPETASSEASGDSTLASSTCDSGRTRWHLDDRRACAIIG